MNSRNPLTPLLLGLLAGAAACHAVDSGSAASSRGSARAGASDSEPLGRLEWQELGRSVQDRKIEVRRFGRGPVRVLWVGGIHGNEVEGKVATEELPAELAAIPGLLERIRVCQVRDLNPDGRVLNRRGNANGVDLNRNFPAHTFKASARYGREPLDQPESTSLYRLILDEAPHLILVAHSTRGRRFINWDGPGRRFAEIFSRASGFPLVESDTLHPTPGSLGTWAGLDRQIPILTLEWHNGTDPDEAWRMARTAILGVFEAAAHIDS